MRLKMWIKDTLDLSRIEWRWISQMAAWDGLLRISTKPLFKELLGVAKFRSVGMLTLCLVTYF